METIQNTNGMNFLKQIKDNSVDLVVTDPPYVISRKTGFKEMGKKGVKRLGVSMEFGQWDENFTKSSFSKIIKEYFRVCRKGGAVIIFYDLWKIQELKDLLEKHGFKQIRFIEWVKDNPVPINSKVNYLSNSREVAVVAVKGGKCTFHSKYDNGIYNYPIYHNKGRFHPTQKPVKLIEEIIRKHSNKGDTVLDTFLGSGTTAIAAQNTNRKCLGCERDTNYFTKLTKRIEGNHGTN